MFHIKLKEITNAATWQQIIYPVEGVNRSSQLLQTMAMLHIKLKGMTNAPTCKHIITRNWRPISLLNVDYKIATKAIANRVKGVTSSLVHNSQTGFIKGRYIALLFEIKANAKIENKPGLISFSDFDKAFNSINHTFIISCLRHYNFGEYFIRWVKPFYNDAKSCVSNNGNLSNFFPILRGARQGCPLSTYLFIMCI